MSNEPRSSQIRKMPFVIFGIILAVLVGYGLFALGRQSADPGPEAAEVAAAPTDTPAEVSSNTPEPTIAETDTPDPTETSTPEPTATEVPTETPVPTDTPSPTSTETLTPSPSPTSTATATLPTSQGNSPETWLAEQQFSPPVCDPKTYIGWIEQEFNPTGTGAMQFDMTADENQIYVVWGSGVQVDGRDYGRSLVILEGPSRHQVQIQNGAYRLGRDADGIFPEYWARVLACLYGGDWNPIEITP